MTGRAAKRLRRLEEALLPEDKTLLSLPVQWIDTETGEIVAELPPAPVEKVDYRRGLVYEASSL
jgi:predicted component of type VI protein secretion system